MSPVAAGQINSRPLPEFSHPSLSLQKNALRIHTAHFYPSRMVTHVFLKSGVSCLQQLWQLLPAANDDIFWVTHLFDSGFMDTFAFGQTNVQIGHSCINSDYSWGQTYLAVPHSHLRNCSTVRLGKHVPNICKTSAVLSFEHHALRACPPSLPMWVCMWNDLRDIWKASCLCS